MREKPVNKRKMENFFSNQMHESGRSFLHKRTSSFSYIFKRVSFREQDLSSMNSSLRRHLIQKNNERTKEK